MKYANFLFAPAFVLLIHYFELRLVVFLYLLMAVGFFIYMYTKKSSFRDMIVPCMYVAVLSIAFYFSSLEMVKYMPATISSIFLLMFIDSHFNKKYMILGFTDKFYKRKLSQAEIEFLKRGDLYWVLVMLVNTVIHIYIVNFYDDIIWAFYSSIGWYIWFFICLIAQIAYGKVYGVKVSSR